MSAAIVAGPETHVRFLYKGQSYLVPLDFITKVHPGGKRLLLKFKDGDITDAFTDAEHSDDALEMLEEWIENATPEQRAALKRRAEDRDRTLNEWRWRSTAIAFTVATVVAAFLFRRRQQQ